MRPAWVPILSGKACGTRASSRGRVTESHASGFGFFFTARGRATGAASAGATESEASTGAGDFVAFFGAAGAGLAGAGAALAAGGVDGDEVAARGVMEVGELIGRGALAPSGRDVPLAVGRGSPPPPMGRELLLPSDRLCVDEPPGTGGRGAPGRIDGAPPSCRLVGPGVTVASGAPGAPGALGDWPPRLRERRPELSGGRGVP